MYISIDLDKMQFSAKHEDYRVICDLDFIHHRHCDLFPITWTGGLKHRTETELQLLYKHTTGEDHSPYHGDELRKVLFDLMEKLPVTDVAAFEAERQAAYIEKLDKKGLPGYVYVKGATTPAKPGDLFSPPFLKATITPEEAAAAVARKRTAPAQQPSTSNDATSVVSAPSRPARTPGAPRAGGTREVIWKVADDIWQRDGSPSEKNAVLAIRKRVMDVLEKDHGIKRTSASSELGNWQKARI